jgi:carbonic anhydrase
MGENMINACVNANILHSVHQVQLQSEIIKKKIDAKELQLVAGRYELSSGKVTLLRQ